MKINYPIKYSVMPIIEQVGWSPGMHELERKYDVVCYIVSKCYLISDLTKYTEDGRTIKEYEVVFPYHPVDINRWQRIIPTYNLMHGYCTNSNKTDKVFDSYEDALNYALIKNEMLCDKLLGYLPYSTNIAEEIQQKKVAFDAKLAKYKMLEQQILLHTDDIKIGLNKELNNVIKIVNNSGKILSCSIYEVLRLFDNDKFIVYNISQEQYDTLMKLSGTEEVKPILGHIQCLLVHKNRDDVIKLAIEEGCGAYYIKNGSICYDSQMDKVTKNDFENLDGDTLIFYTTETMDDLVSSYTKYPQIDLGQIQGSVLKKVKNRS